MEKIYSKVQDGLLLHVIYRIDEFMNEREEVIPADEFIQCASLKLNAGRTFRPHKHYERERHYDDYTPQESWVVIKGRVKCIFYDIDDTIIATPVLYEGDASFTLHGGHTYRVLQDSLVYEFKTGRYFGQKDDKIFLDEQL